jgi:Protein of unknown function (DUF1573)
VKSRLNRTVWGLLISTAILTDAMVRVSAQHAISASPSSTPQVGLTGQPGSVAAPGPQAASASTQLVWESEHKEAATKDTQISAEFCFGVTNISDSEVVIDRVKASCSCTVAKLPSQPWHLAPHTNGQIGVSVDLKGKIGTFDKTLTEISAKVLDYFNQSNTMVHAI